MAVLWITLLVAATVDIWSEPSLVDVREVNHRSPWADDIGRIYAARGERESFQLVVRPKRKGLENLRIEADPVDETVGAPTVYRVGSLQTLSPSPRALGRAGAWPDVLLEPKPLKLASGEFAVFWLTYTIPADARPGIRRAAVHVLSEGQRKRSVEVRVEVFDFELPETPSLRSLFSFSRSAIQDVFGIGNASIEDWKPLYDALTAYRIGFPVWEGGGLVQIPGADAVDTEPLEQHLAWAAPAMACVELGGGLARFPEPTSASSGPLGIYLAHMAAWLDEHGWLSRACVWVRPRTRDGWPGAREACGRVAQAAERIPRLLVAPPYPGFEPYVDYWAVPLAAYSPGLFGRFRDGLSLAARPAWPARAVTASCFGPIPASPEHATQPGDAYDGSPFSVWTSGATPSRKQPVWLQLSFESAITLQHLELAWENGMESDDIEVLTSFDNQVFTGASVDWDHRGPRYPYARSTSVGEFRYENTFVALRLLFRGSVAGKAVGIAEVVLGTVPPAPPRPVPSVQPWLSLRAEAFPSLCVDVHPAEARLAPWACWRFAFAGIVYEGLNRWPQAWADRPQPLPQVWHGGAQGQDFLFYPGGQALLPSVRLERFRDGLEDYEYLRLVEQAVLGGAQAGREALEWAAHQAGAVAPDEAFLSRLTHQLPEQRIRMGRALHERARQAGKSSASP